MRQAGYWVPKQPLCRKGPDVCGGQWAEQEPTVCSSNMAVHYNFWVSLIGSQPAGQRE